MNQLWQTRNQSAESARPAIIPLATRHEIPVVFGTVSGYLKFEVPHSNLRINTKASFFHSPASEATNEWQFDPDSRVLEAGYQTQDSSLCLVHRLLADRHPGVHNRLSVLWTTVSTTDLMAKYVMWVYMRSFALRLSSFLHQFQYSSVFQSFSALYKRLIRSYFIFIPYSHAVQATSLHTTQ